MSEFYEQSKSRMLNNVELAEWIRQLEDQVKAKKRTKQAKTADIIHAHNVRKSTKRRILGNSNEIGDFDR